MTINTGSGSRTLAFSLQSGGNGNIIWYDTSQGFQGSGVLLKQTTPVALSKITGPYAMGLIGVDQGGNRFGVAGAFTANGTADWVSGQLDANDSGNVNSGNGTSSPIPSVRAMLVQSMRRPGGALSGLTFPGLAR